MRTESLHAGRSKPTVLSITPWVPSADAPYAGHQFYHRYLSRIAETFDVRVWAPDIEANRRSAATITSWEVDLVAPSATSSRARSLGRVGVEVGALRIGGRGTIVPSLANLGERYPVHPDVVELCWAQTLPLAPEVRGLFPSTFLSAMQHDLYSETLKWSKLSDLRLRQRLRDTLAGRLIAREEQRLFTSCDLILTFRRSDVELLQACDVATPTIVLDPWLDFAGERCISTTRRDVLFVGAFNRRENCLGALWLLDHVWPGVIAEHPDARLVLAGSGAGEELISRQDSSVSVTGFVDDLAPYYLAAHCVVAPIFAGGGLRFKVPQALNYGIPVVATAEALAGLEDRPAGCIAGVSSDPAKFTSAVNWTLSEPMAASAGARLAQSWVRERFSFDRSVGAVRDLYLRNEHR